MKYKDEGDYEREDKQDLTARLMGAQMLSQFLMRAYTILRSYGVDFMKLPEWTNQNELDEAMKLKPHAAQHKIGHYFQKLNNALTAAVRRASFKVTTNKKD